MEHLNTPYRHHPGWIIGSAVRCVRFIAEEANLGGLLRHALTHTENAQPLLLSVDRLARRSGDREGAAAARRLAESAPFDEEMARDLRVSDYAALNAHSLIAIWGALETSVEDTVVDILVQRPDSGALIDALGIKRTVLAQPDDDQARFLYIKVERKLHVPADVVETNLAILRHFGLDLTIDSATAMTLREAGAVRNCLVHRGGRIDSRAAREAPSLTPRIGMDGAVTSDSFLRYHTAVGAWAMALMRAGSESIYYPR